MTETRAMRTHLASATGGGQPTISVSKPSGAANGPAGRAVLPARRAKGRGMLFALMGGGCLLFVPLASGVGADVAPTTGGTSADAVALVARDVAEAETPATSLAPDGRAVVRMAAAPAQSPDATPPKAAPPTATTTKVGTTTTVADMAPALPMIKVTTEVLWQELPPAPTVLGTPPAPAPAIPRKVAVFVNNRANAAFNNQVLSLEDKVIANLAGADFAPISKDDTVQALNQFATDEAGTPDRNTLGTQADRLLADQTTALNLARNMGADFLMTVNISTITATAKDLAAAGIQGGMFNYNVGVNYRICDGSTGAALDGGGTFNLKKSVRFSGATPQADPAVVEEMMDDAALRVTEKLSASATKIKAVPLPPDVEILIAAAPRDLQGQEISLPDLRVSEDNMIAAPAAMLPVQLAATIEIDGMAAGTTPVRLRVVPGMHKLRLSRPGFEDVNLTVNAKQGLTLTPAMTMSAEGFQRWREIRAFLLSLDVTRELTAAQTEDIRGHAQMLRQSGFKVDYSLKVQEDHKSDIKSDTKVNTKDAPRVTVKKSIFSLD